jgi:hypothetical protein
MGTAPLLARLCPLEATQRRLGAHVVQWAGTFADAACRERPDSPARRARRHAARAGRRGGAQRTPASHLPFLEQGDLVLGLAVAGRARARPACGTSRRIAPAQRGHGEPPRRLECPGGAGDGAASWRSQPRAWASSSCPGDAPAGTTWHENSSACRELTSSAIADDVARGGDRQDRCRGVESSQSWRPRRFF